MLISAASVIDRSDPSGASSYEPGVCNIGPVEIAARRRSGHVAALATLGLLGLLVAVDAPPLTRLLVALPAMVAASGYLQARLRFCAQFGARGVYNFGPLGRNVRSLDREARARDRAMAVRIGLACVAIGSAVGVVAALIPA